MGGKDISLNGHERTLDFSARFCYIISRKQGLRRLISPGYAVSVSKAVRRWKEEDLL
jgi:hypothetical protein